MTTPTTSTDPLVEALATRLRLIDLAGGQRICIPDASHAAPEARRGVRPGSDAVVSYPEATPQPILEAAALPVAA